jgi:hypothetical protein
VNGLAGFIYTCKLHAPASIGYDKYRSQEQDMKTISNLVLGLIIGMAFGLWFGINLAKDKPLFSNPFSDPTIHERLKETGAKVIEKSQEALQKGEKTVRDKVMK